MNADAEYRPVLVATFQPGARHFPDWKKVESLQDVYAPLSQNALLGSDLKFEKLCPVTIRHNRLVTLPDGLPWQEMIEDVSAINLSVCASRVLDQLRFEYKAYSSFEHKVRPVLVKIEYKTGEIRTITAREVWARLTFFVPPGLNLMDGDGLFLPMAVPSAELDKQIVDMILGWTEGVQYEFRSGIVCCGGKALRPSFRLEDALFVAKESGLEDWPPYTEPARLCAWLCRTVIKRMEAIG